MSSLAIHRRVPFAAWRQGLRAFKHLFGFERAGNGAMCVLQRLSVKIATPLTWIFLEKFPYRNERYSNIWEFGSLRGFPSAQIRLNPKDLGGRHFAATDFWEPALSRLIALPERKGLLINVGANYGYFSYSGARSRGPG